jgi:hypothetical protein
MAENPSHFDPAVSGAGPPVIREIVAAKIRQVLGCDGRPDDSFPRALRAIRPENIKKKRGKHVCRAFFAPRRASEFIRRRPFLQQIVTSRVMIGISPFSFPFLGQNITHDLSKTGRMLYNGINSKACPSEVRRCIKFSWSTTSRKSGAH